MIDHKIELQELAGVWYIIKTNFPMWLKGDRTNPVFDYSKGEKNGKTGLVDHVRFEKNGKKKSIDGFDFPQNANNTKFIWRGAGWLSFVTSRWEIIELRDDIAMIYFEKTLFTPEGYDVISREKQLTEDQEETVSKWLEKYEIDGLMKSL